MSQLGLYVLPIPDRPYSGPVTYDAKDPDTSFPPIEPLRPPAGAPNVLIVLIDDCGFGASSAFGGPIETPTAERLAAGGLRYNRFHTTALCSPTRQALLTGRNHHAVGMGGITEIATSAPGYNSIRPNTAAPLAETLQAQRLLHRPVRQVPRGPGVGDQPDGAVRPVADRVRASSTSTGSSAARPTSGRRRSTATRCRSSRDRTPEEGYHFTEDMTDQAIEWVRQQKALMPDKPFFVYYAPGATHAPHHVPPEWSDKYKGKFDQGWDRLREETFARQKELGVIPADAELTARPAEIPAWDDMPDDLKPVLARQMEVYAGLPRAHRPPRRPAGRRARRPRDPRRHADLLHHRRQRRLGRGHAQRLLQRAGRPQRRVRARDHRVHDGAHRRVRHAPRRTTTTPSAGRTRWTRRTSGPSRSPRTGAAPATAPSCTGPAASRRRARSGPSSTMSSTSPRRCSRPPACPSR